MKECKKVRRFAKKGYSHFRREEENQSSIIYGYVVIGEAVKNLPQDLLDKYSFMNWKQLKAFRDYLVHNYYKLNLVRVWAAVEDLANLQRTVQQMIIDLETLESDSTSNTNLTSPPLD